MSKNADGGSSGKFVGGAELARRNARKKTATRILRPGETLQAKEFLSRKMPPMERFFASLFRSPASHFLQANCSEEARSRLIRDVCRRLGLAEPNRLQPLYKKRSDHFEARAALVMEESRHLVSEALSRTWKGTNTCIRVSFQSMQTRKEPGHVLFSFEKRTAFSAKEMYDIRPGCCFEILPPGPLSIERSLLACVVCNARDFDDDCHTISLMVFSSFGKMPSGDWHIRPITAMISMLRQFEACINAQCVPFLYALMGHKDGTHTRFESDDEPSCSSNDEEEKKEDVVTVHKVFNLPTLNKTQESASHTFLRSSPGSITLVQGPPGTGKTTLLMTIICRYLIESKAMGVKRRLMVCAPTNKAITVLVTRYLESIRETTHDPSNVVMIGDQDKLLVEEKGLHDDSPPAFQVRNVFVYTWIHGVVEDCKYIQRKLHSGSLDVSSLLTRTHRLCHRLVNSLPRTTADSGLASLLRDVHKAVSTVVPSGTLHLSVCRIWGDALDALASEVLTLDPSYIVRELLESADVVFCTLASAGSTLVKSTSSMDDLIVDEAAAATEPELYIPFHLNPRRLLVVGDPKQLPATVLSRAAERLGLAQSLHERLMYELNWDHIMLDVQYRMMPEISQFPSARFYASKIVDGENVISPLYKNGVSLLNGDAYAFLQVTGVERQAPGGSYCNTAEAEAVLELVKQLRAASNATEWYSVERIRIITFYQAQVSHLKQLLSENGLGQIVVATVDSSQGCEADIVIVSFVRSNDARPGGNHWAGFLSDDRRLNVALTRAKYQLVCVGNARGFQSISGASTLQSLSLDAQERNIVLSDEVLRLNHQMKAFVENAKKKKPRSSDRGSRKRSKTSSTP